LKPPAISTKVGATSDLHLLLPIHYPKSLGVWVWIFLICLYLILIFLITANGFWTLDNGLKYLAIRHQVTQPFHSITLPLPHPEIDPWNEAAPLIPPFVHHQDGKLIPVFAPLFIVFCALVWRFLGQWILPWIPWVATLCLFFICWRVFFAKLKDNAIPAVLLLALASPITFYSFTLWEHTQSILCVTAGIALTFHSSDSKSLWRWFFAGLLLGVGGMLRLEGWLVAISWAIVVFSNSNRVLWTTMIMGLIVAAFLWMGTNLWWTGSLLPLQFFENWKAAGYSQDYSSILTWIISRWKTIVNLLFSAHSQPIVNLVLNGVFLIGATVSFAARKLNISRVGLGLMLGSYLTFLVLELNLSYPIAATAVTGGLIWCCPWVVFAIPRLRQKGESRRLLIAILITIILIVLITPISRGIHFGPRILLVIIPLFAIIVSKVKFSAERHGAFQIAAWILIGLSVIHQGRGIELLARQKSLNANLTARISQLEEEIILTDLWWVPADMARTWDHHSYFLISRKEVLEDLLFHLKVNDVKKFAYYSESPATISKLELPIRVVDRSVWDIGERSPIIVEHVIMTDDSLKWAQLATQVGMRQYQPETMDRSLCPFETSVNWNPEDPEAWYRLGTLKMQMWDEDGARHAFETAVSIDSTHQRSLKALRYWRNRP
jgi:hypothetical protein